MLRTDLFTLAAPEAVRRLAVAAACNDAVIHVRLIHHAKGMYEPGRMEAFHDLTIQILESIVTGGDAEEYLNPALLPPRGSSWTCLRRYGQ